MSDNSKKNICSSVALNPSFPVIGKDWGQEDMILAMNPGNTRSWSIVSEDGRCVATDVDRAALNHRFFTGSDLERETGEESEAKETVAKLEARDDRIDEGGFEGHEKETSVLEQPIPVSGPVSPLTVYSQNRDTRTKVPVQPEASTGLFSKDTDRITDLLAKNGIFDSQAAAERLELIYNSKHEEEVKEPQKPTAAFRSANDGLDLPQTVDVPQELFQSSSLLSEVTVQESLRLVSEEHLAPPPPHFSPALKKQRTGFASTHPIEFVVKKAGATTSQPVSSFPCFAVGTGSFPGESDLESLIDSWPQLSQRQRAQILAIVRR